jgi:hypothetical protein
MSRYNQKSTSTVETVTNHQGGVAVKLDPKMELVAILATGFDNTYYEKLSDREVRFANLIKEVASKDFEFVAKALVYARSVMGQRSVTHFGAVQLAKHLSGTQLGSRFFSKRDRKAERGGIIYRLDDILEIIACYQAINPGKPLPNSIKRGFKSALESADTYELAKYQGKGKSVSMVDVVNLVHPKPKKGMEDTFRKLMTGELKQFDTVEDKNTTAGQEVAAKVKAGTITKAQAEVELKEAKEDNYRELITSKKIGYLALLRNMRNILNNSKDADLIDAACGLLTNEDFIRKSLVFPHQIDLALEIILDEATSPSARNKVVAALNKAYELSIPNMSELGLFGRTAVVLDKSGSMSSRIRMAQNYSKNSSALDKGALVAATFAKGIGADVFTFADTCAPVNSLNLTDSINTIKSRILNSRSVGGGTAFRTIAPVVKGYDRVIIISDMQGRDSVMSAFGNNVHVYCIDMCGYGTTVIKPGSKVYQLFGYSSEMYELAKKVEIDPKALIKAINAIVI